MLRSMNVSSGTARLVGDSRKNRKKIDVSDGDDGIRIILDLSDEG